MKKYGIATVAALLAALLLASTVLALFTNGSFETGDFTGWTQTQFLNPGLAGSQPFTGTSIVRNPGGSDQSLVLGPFAALSQTDANSGGSVAYPAYGSYVARINGPTTGQISNTIYQETTVGAGDVDPIDGLYHVRFVYAAVMEDPGHVPAEQPWFYVVVKNVTKGTTLYEKFSYVGEPGVPWMVAGSWKYLDWTLVDINPGAGNLDLGDTLSLEAIGADCALGGHAGYVYVDEFGPFIPGPTIVADGPATAASGGSITYTYNYFNGAAAAIDANVTINEPVGVDFTSSNDVNCSVGAGSVTCAFTAVGSGIGGSFTVTGDVTAPSGSTISHGDYNIGAVGYPTVGGPLVTTNVPANAAPVAVDDAYATTNDVTYNGASVLGNDTDGDSDPLTAILVSAPANAASFTLNADGTFSYKANSTFTGDDTFTYKANDSTVDSNVATATISVRNPSMIFRSQGDKDGWVLEASEGSNVGGQFFDGVSLSAFEELAWNNKDATADIIVGDNYLDRQYRGFLHFYTGALPDNATIVKVTLKLKFQQFVGNNPFATHSNLIVDLVSGFYGSSSDLEITDFESAKGRNYAAFLGSPSGGWSVAILRSTALSNINLTGATQFRLHFNLPDNDNLKVDYVQFFSGGAAFADRPVLIVEYTVP